MMKKIPTFLALILVIALVVAVALTTNTVSTITTSFFSKADANLAPIGDVGIANITENSFVVYWQTPSETVGVVYFGTTLNLGDGVAVDDRNLSNPNGKYTTHFVRVPNLKATTKYYFRVSNVASTTIPLETTTTGKVSSPPATNPIFGKVIDQNSTPVNGAIVVWSSGSNPVLAALTKSDGSFVIPVLKSLADGTSETLSILNNGETTSITCQIGNDRPIPDMKLGQPGDCKNSAGKTTSFGVATGSGNLTTGGTLQINLSDGQQLSPLPTFTGKSGVNQMVNILIKVPTDLNGTVKADVGGVWSWSPPSSLSLGSHTITVSVTNPDNSKQEITKGFVVVSDIPILPVTSGTPSANVEHKACVNNTCVAVTGAGSDTCATDRECQPVATPSPTPVPEQQYQSGVWENTAILLVGGLLLAGLGSVFLFL